MSLRRPVGVLAGVCAVLCSCALPLHAQHPAVDSAFVRAAERPGAPVVELVGPPVMFAPGRYFGVAARSAEMMAAAVTVVACVADSAATITVACAPVPTPRIQHNLFAVDSATDRGHDDLDGDGVAELRFSLGYLTVPAPAVGEDSYVRHFVYRPAASGPRLLLQFIVSEGPGASVLPRRIGRLVLEDRNQDGVRDFVVEGELWSSAGPDARCRPFRATWEYRRSVRTWVRVTAGAGRASCEP